MPLYDYTCADCGKTSEILIKNREERPACPCCGGQHLARQLSTFAAVTHAAGDAGLCCRTGEPRGHAHGPGCGCCAGGGACDLN